MYLEKCALFVYIL